MHPPVFLFLALYSLSSISFGEASEGIKGFNIDLIHYDSPLSPFYNPSLTPSQRFINAALHSNSRLNRLSQFLLGENKLPESLLIPDQAQYLMRFYIGTPPVERFALMDTGSSLIWVQCSPCLNCEPQNTPLFEPLKSSTFKSVTCDSQQCISLSRHHCGKLNQCIYETVYGDRSFSVGILATETLSFGSNGSVETISFPNSFFGCGLSNEFTAYKSMKNTGIVGIGGGPLSLVSQLGAQIGNKFSYCLLPINSPSTGKLKFGSEAIINTSGVVSTPLIIKPSLPSHYFLNLEAITIGEKVVPTGQTNGNIIIDSGTPLTYLEPTFYKNFMALLQQTLGVELVKDLPFPLNSCFPYSSNLVIPDMTFQFTGANVTLRAKNIVIPIPIRDNLCLAVVPDQGLELSIFGSIAQYDFHVGYDLEAKKVSFAPTDCSKV